MIDLKDPSMKEIVDEFCNECYNLIPQLEEILENVEDDSSEAKRLEEFGQIIDRMMGAAKSIGAPKISIFCEMGKTIGYKAGQVSETALIEVVVAVLFDSLEILKKMLKSLKEGEGEGLAGINTDAFVTRLKWLADKFSHISRSSVAIGDEKSINECISQLGLGSQDKG